MPRLWTMERTQVPHAAAPGPVAARRAPHLEERVLREVLRGLPLVHQAVGQPVGGAGVAVVEGGEGARVVRPDQGDQVFVAQARVALLAAPSPHPRRPFLRDRAPSFYLLSRIPIWPNAAATATPRPPPRAKMYQSV
jgi:hypothetical protein